MSPHYSCRFVAGCAAFVLASILGIVGCNRQTPPPTPSPPAGSRPDNFLLPEVKPYAEAPLVRAQAGTATWGQDLVFVVMSDLPGGSSAGSSIGEGKPNAMFQGSHGSLDDRHIKWNCVTPDGKTGRITINGKEYDLEQGGLFLVSSKGVEIRVLQLRRDLSKARAETESLQRWILADPAVMPFFANAAGPK